MENIVKVLINTTFDKVTFISGFLLVLLGIICTKPLAIGNVNLPAIDKNGRIISTLIGSFLILVSLLIWFATYATVGIFSQKPKEVGHAHILNIVGQAYANDKHYSIQQYKLKKIIISNNDNIGIYADNIKPRKPSNIILFEINFLIVA